MINNVQPYHPGVVPIEQALYSASALHIGENKFPHFQTLDFPLTDPWSGALRAVLMRLTTKGWVQGKSIIELGIGDGRNMKVVAVMDSPQEIIGIDVVDWKLELAWKNLQGTIVPNKLRLYHTGSVEFLSQWNLIYRKKFSGRVVMCLPQSFGSGTSADVYSPADYEGFRRWTKYGLSLNAASLVVLGQISSSATQVLIVLSDRIAEKTRLSMIESCGWSVVAEEARTLVRQDKDTDLTWMLDLADDGKRFYDEQGRALSIPEAVWRQKDALIHGKELDLYHYLSVYRLALKSARVS